MVGPLQRLDCGLPPETERPVAVMCASGQRAAVAASLVQGYNAERVLDGVNGGVPSVVASATAPKRPLIRSGLRTKSLQLPRPDRLAPVALAADL